MIFYLTQTIFKTKLWKSIENENRSKKSEESKSKNMIEYNKTQKFLLYFSSQMLFINLIFELHIG